MSAHRFSVGEKIWYVTIAPKLFVPKFVIDRYVIVAKLYNGYKIVNEKYVDTPNKNLKRISVGENQVFSTEKEAFDYACFLVNSKVINSLEYEKEKIEKGIQRARDFIDQYKKDRFGISGNPEIDELMEF